MKRTFFAFAALWFVCSLASPPALVYAADAEGIESLIFQAVPNVVTPGRREISIKESPNAISVITRSEILYSPCHTITELLQYVVGMDTYQKTLTQTCDIARGMVFDESPEMVVLIDGQPVNVAVYSGMQWNTLPITLDDIERIEVVRGPASAVYGADALTGVINIITVPVKDRKASIRAMLGENGTEEVDVHTSQMLTDKLGVAATVGYNQVQAKGFSDADQARFPIANGDIKDWADINLLNYRLDYADSMVTVMSETGFSQDQEGYNPSPGDPSIDLSNKQTLISSNKVSMLIDKDELSLNAGVRNLWQRNWKWTGTEYDYKYTVEPAYGIDSTLQYILRRLAYNTVTIGINYDYLNAGRNIQNPIPYTYNQVDRLAGGFLQDQVSLLDSTLLFTATGRYDKWSSLDGVFSPSLAANYLALDKTLTFRLSAGTSFHRPDFDSQYYYVDLSGISPNSWFKGTQLTLTEANGQVAQGSNLKPSTNLTYEAGVRYDPDPSFTTNLTFSHESIKDLASLYYVYENGVYSAYDAAKGPVGLDLSYENNKGTVQIEGLEFEISKSFSNQVKLWGNWTGQQGWSIDENGTRAAWEAMPKIKLAVGILITGTLNLDLRERYVSDVYFNEIGAPANHVAAYHTMDVSVFKEFGKFMIKLAVTDLLNDVHYEYPLYTEMVRKAMLSTQYSF